MKILFIYLFASLIFSLFSLFSQVSIAGISNDTAHHKMVKNIHWFGQAAMKIQAETKTIYIDPYQLTKKDKADIILITHSHSDHLSKGDIEKIICDNTILIAPQSCEASVKDIKAKGIVLLKPGESHTIGKIKIDAVPAYNIKKTNYHPKENGWLGYIITVKGIKIYHAGDTERIPEMKKFDCDIALLPLGQTYTMNSVEDAVETACDVKAKIAIPMHFGMYEGTKKDAIKFQTLLKNKVEVIILQQKK